MNAQQDLGCVLPGQSHALMTLQISNGYGWYVAMHNLD